MGIFEALANIFSKPEKETQKNDLSPKPERDQTNELKLSKTGQLEALNDRILETIGDYQNREYRVADTHFITYAGNPTSNIAVVCMHPDRCELEWAKRENIHSKFVCFGPDNQLLRRTAEFAGFNIEQDLFFMNVVPFYSLGGDRYQEDAIKHFQWIFDEIIDIAKPEYLVLIGMDVFQAVVGEISRKQFLKLINSNSTIKLDNFIIVPIEDTKEVLNNNTKKNGAFFKTLRRLHVKANNQE